MSERYRKTDVLVIGSGIAGLAFALHAGRDCEVTIATKREQDASSTRWAQGGIASVTSEEDDFESHIEDTLTAGDGLCHREVVEAVVRDGPNRIEDLLAWGVRFSRKGGEASAALDLGREGGHSFRRILHAGDFTGEEVERAMLETVATRPNVLLLEDHMAVDVITSRHLGPSSAEGPACHGAYLLDRRTGAIVKVASRATVLATGGAGKVYLYTSNPDIATGDGVAIAYRAGARIANMEFFQFHPTCLYHPSARNFLVSEAVRGEGAVLRRAGDMQPLMQGVHPSKDLAPRDVVARAIDAEMKRTGAEFVYLDITHRGADFVRSRFPNIHARCLSYGIDMTAGPIPVVPAAHYLCGGVATDLDGATSIPGLYAIGETACTGLHGANRLASNSLLEALVFAHRAAGTIAARARPGELPLRDVPDWTVGEATESNESVVVTQDWDEIRRAMWNYVGIVRSEKRLERARRRLDLLKREIAEYYWKYLVTADLLELRNIATVADLIVRSASLRKESRGLHHNDDYPGRDDDRWRRDTVIERKGGRRGARGFTS